MTAISASLLFLTLQLSFLAKLVTQERVIFFFSLAPSLVEFLLALLFFFYLFLRFLSPLPW